MEPMKTYKQWRAEHWSDRGSEVDARHWYKRYCQRYAMRADRARLEQQHTAAVNKMPVEEREVDAKKYAKMAADVMAETAAAREIVHAVYTGQKSDAELGKALDALANVLRLITPHDDGSVWFNNMTDDVMHNIRCARVLAGYVYTGDASDASLGKVLDYITAANRALDQHGQVFGREGQRYGQG